MKNDRTDSDNPPAGLELPDVVDAVIAMPDGTTMLVMCAMEEWGENGASVAKLMAKFDTYLKFIYSEQIYENYPTTKGTPLKITLRCNFPLPSKETEFVDSCRRTYLEPRGVALQIDVRPVK